MNSLIRQVCVVLAGAVVFCVCGTGCRRDYSGDAAHYQRVLGWPEDADSTSVSATQPSAPLTLGEALHRTNRHNERLGLEGEQYVQALIDKQRAVAEFLPTVSFAPQYSRRSGDLSGDGARDEFEGSVLGELNIFDGFRDVANLYRSAATIRQREAILLQFQADLLLETAAAFFEVLRLEQAVVVLTNTVALQEERLRDISTRQEAGLARPLEVSQAQAQAAETRATLITAETASRNARTALGLLTGAPIGNVSLMDDLVLPDSVVEVDHWQAMAAERRDDIRAAEAALEAARHVVEAAFGQYYPSVTLDLEYLLTTSSAATAHEWNAVLRANVPIFSAGRIEADVRTAWSRVRQAQLKTSRARREAWRDVERAYDVFSSAGRRGEELERRVVAAELALRQAEASYDVGLATNLDRLRAQDDLLAARLDLLTQDFVWKVAYLALLRAGGRLPEEMGVGARAEMTGP